MVQKKKFILNIPEDLMFRLRRLSYCEQQSMTAIMTEALLVSLETYESTFSARHGYEIPPLGRPEVARKTA